MKFEIKSKIDGKILFSIETESWKLAVEAAVKDRANLSFADLRSANLSFADLRSANLSSADLRSANLSFANLRSANLSSADLRFANLSSANLSFADLRSANLSFANLRFANLSSANLRSANLSSANLSFADLRSANLSSANLSSADLSSAKGINKYICTPLLILVDQPGKIRAYKLVNKKGEGPFNGGIKYEIGKTFSVPYANKEEYQQCAAGINLATLDWCIKEWKESYKILIAEFTVADIAVIPIATDGKFRVSKCKIVGEKNLEEIGLIKAKKENK